MLKLEANPGLCLDVQGGQLRDGANVQLWHVNSSSAQKFSIAEHLPFYNLGEYIGAGCQRKTFHVKSCPRKVIKIGKNKKSDFRRDVKELGSAKWWANKFSERLRRHGIDRIVKYVDSSRALTTDSGEFQLAQIEDKLPGDFKKFNTAVAEAFKDEHNVSWTPNAFSHFTYQETQGNMLITDVQGVQQGNSYILSDPFIHTDRVQMKLWMRRHVCNGHCKKLGLKRVGF